VYPPYIHTTDVMIRPYSYEKAIGLSILSEFCLASGCHDRHVDNPIGIGSRCPLTK
jgi:hypothetical protein